MSKLTKIILIFVLAISFTLSYCYGIDLNLTENSTKTNSTATNSNPTNNTSNSNTITSNSSAANTISNTSSTVSSISNVSTSNTSTITNLINIALIVIGVLLIFFAIAILIRLSSH